MSFIDESGDDDPFEDMDDGQAEMPRQVGARAIMGHSPEPAERKQFSVGATQWMPLDENTFVPCGNTVSVLKPGVYEVHSSNEYPVMFVHIPVKTDALIKFPDGVTDRIVGEIQDFWSREHLFRQYKLAYKRGILMYGPAGSGKTSTLQFVIADVVERGGIAIKMTNPILLGMALRKLRDVQPDVPVVVTMEDIDSTIEDYSETQVLNILDGVDRIDKVVFIASTNYPEKLGKRIINRPSRFDKRFFIGHPNAECRAIYLRSIAGENAPDGLDVDKWVADTETFSMAHLKELFIAVCILGDDYDAAIKTLRSMCKPVSSGDSGARMGIREEKEGSVPLRW